MEVLLALKVYVGTVIMPKYHVLSIIKMRSGELIVIFHYDGEFEMI